MSQRQRVASKRFCSRGSIYDKNHINIVGLNCPFRHSAYHWPAKIQNNHCIIGDSIIKFLKITNQADIISYPGINIERLYWKIRLNKVRLGSYKVIVVHVGTNDIKECAISLIVSRLQKLVDTIRSKNKSAIIGISSILPKPCDSDDINDKIITVNRDIKRLCGPNSVHFIPSYRPYVGKDKQIKLELYAKDLLHLSYKGSVVLRNNLVGNIKSIQGGTCGKQ